MPARKRAAFVWRDKGTGRFAIRQAPGARRVPVRQAGRDRFGRFARPGQRIPKPVTHPRTRRFLPKEAARKLRQRLPPGAVRKIVFNPQYKAFKTVRKFQGTQWSKLQRQAKAKRPSATRTRAKRLIKKYKTAKALKEAKRRQLRALSRNLERFILEKKVLPSVRRTRKPK